jgi:phosphoribosylformimino-5-aminoimidazole carboxamide ribotide isomerase
MLAIPAIDLREGHCVQLVGGDYANEALRLDEPLRVAQRWVAAGFSRLHIVDLDAATGNGNNRDLVREIVTRCGVPTQVGGGVRRADDVLSVLEDGAEHVVVGTRGIEESEWLTTQSGVHPQRLVLAADVKGRHVVTRGWANQTTREILDVIAELEHLPLAGLLVTAVHKEGRMQGSDLALMTDVVDASPWPVIASGGVSSMSDLRALEDCGVAAAVLGMALYTDALDARIVAEEFCE